MVGLAARAPARDHARISCRTADRATGALRSRRQDHSRSDRQRSTRGGRVRRSQQFSEINAAWGPLAGDEVLAAVGSRLEDFAGKYFDPPGAPTTPVVGRLDSDHFIAIVPEAEGEEGLSADVVRLVRALSTPIAMSGHAIAVSARAAIVQLPAHARTVGSILALGFRLLNHAARIRPDGVAASEDRVAGGFSTLQLEHDLAAALPTEQLFLFLQPKIEIATGRVHGAEALARWRHPARGLIATPDFIEMAEKSGLIFELGLRVLRDACRIAKLPDIDRVADDCRERVGAAALASGFPEPIPGGRRSRRRCAATARD